MQEIALHILDIIQNSISAGATKVVLIVNYNEDGCVTFTVIDNGQGMSPEMVATLSDPMTTTRTTRKVGMGIPLLCMTTEQCQGGVVITSKIGEGTTIKASFLKSHWDRPPMGNLAETLKVVLVGNQQLRLQVEIINEDKKFEFDTQQVEELMGMAVDYSLPTMSQWIEEYLRQEINKVEGGN